MLQTVEPLVFVGERKGESKSGNPYQFIKLANPKTYENYEMFAENVNLSGVFKGDLVNVDLALTAGFGKTNVSVVAVKAAV